MNYNQKHSYNENKYSKNSKSFHEPYGSHLIIAVLTKKAMKTLCINSVSLTYSDPIQVIYKLPCNAFEPT